MARKLLISLPEGNQRMLPVFPVVTFSSHSSGRRTKGPPPYVLGGRVEVAFQGTGHDSSARPQIVKIQKITEHPKISDFDQISNKSPKSLSKAITRNSNFSVARVCKIPRGGGLGTSAFLSNTREIRISSDRLGKEFFDVLEIGQNRTKSAPRF